MQQGLFQVPILRFNLLHVEIDIIGIHTC